MKCAALLAALLALAGTASAEPGRRPALHWVRQEGAEHCIDPRSLAERVERITGPVLVSAANADLSIEARVVGAADGTFLARIHLTAATAPARGERVVTLPAADCRKHDDAIAFLIAMSIDPSIGPEGALAGLEWLAAEPAAEAELLKRELTPAPATPERDVLSETLARDEDPKAAPVSRSEPPLVTSRSWELTAAMGGGSGATSGPAATAIVSMARSVSARLALAAQLRAAHEFDDQALDRVRSVTTQTVGAALLACYSLFDPRIVGLAGCAGPEFQLLIASGHGFSDESVAFLPSFGAAARIDAKHRFGAHWGVVASAHVQLDALTPTVYYRREGERMDLFEPEPFAFQLAAGITHVF